MDIIIPEKWYNCLGKKLSKELNKNNHNCPCVFINKFAKWSTIVAVYVDILIRTPEKFEKTVDYLKKEFEMKYFGKWNFISTYRSRETLVGY